MEKQEEKPKNKISFSAIVGIAIVSALFLMAGFISFLFLYKPSENNVRTYPVTTETLKTNNSNSDSIEYKMATIGNGYMD